MIPLRTLIREKSMRWVIIGNGVWARALGQSLLRNPKNLMVKYWARHPLRHDETCNPDVMNEGNIILWAASTHALGSIEPPPEMPVILACKGIQYENGTLCLPSDWFQGRPVGVLSGPTFAHEVMQDLPAALVLASTHPDARVWGEHIKHRLFRVYLSSDIRGVQLGGAIKNVVALASGMCMGLELGQNAAAALITRGLYEMQRIGTHLGAHSETLAGLSGLGDLLLTSTSLHSRNTMLGYNMAHGLTLQQAAQQSTGVVEGVRTTQALYQALGRTLHLPLVTTLYHVLFDNMSVAEGLDILLSQQRHIYEFAA